MDRGVIPRIRSTLATSGPYALEEVFMQIHTAKLMGEYNTIYRQVEPGLLPWIERALPKAQQIETYIMLDGIISFAKRAKVPLSDEIKALILKNKNAVTKGFLQMIVDHEDDEPLYYAEDFIELIDSLPQWPELKVIRNTLSKSY